MVMEFYNALVLIGFVPFVEIVRAQESYDLPTWPTCGQLNEDNFLNFTHISGINEHPWMGRLGYETYHGLSYKCLAVLITNQHLLAPAHCFDDNEKMPVSYVLLGDWNPTNSYIDTDCDNQHMCNRLPKLMEIDEIIINPDYNSEDLTNDISVLKLTQPIVLFSSSIRPICLPSINSQNNQHIGKLIYTSGFALDAGLPYKLKDSVQIVGARQCRRTLANLKHLSAAIPYEMNHICGISSNYRMPMLRGSALMGVHIEGQELQNYYLTGLLVDGEGTMKVPSIFIRVDLYGQWIRRTIQSTASFPATTTTITARSTTITPTRTVTTTTTARTTRTIPTTARTTKATTTTGKTTTATEKAKTIRPSFEIFPAIDTTDDEPRWQ